METKQTAVEWLIEELCSCVTATDKRIVFEKAKQMEKEQIKDAWLWGQDDGATICTPNQQEPEEQFYNENYGKI